MDLPHRDDYTMEEIAELEKLMKEQFPDAEKLVFAGDAPPGGLPPGMQEKIAELTRKAQESLISGACCDCQTKMPNWDKFQDEDWQPAPGWKHFTDHKGNIAMWQCPECDAKDAGGYRGISYMEGEEEQE